MQTLSCYSQHLEKLIPAAGSDRFPRMLVDMLQALVTCQDATIVLYPETGLPIIEYFQVPQQGGRSTLDNFVRGAFLLDPYYLAATREGQFGVFRLRDLSPQGFRDSEYYKTWYRNCGYQDECGYLLPVGAASFVNIALGKTKARARFTRRELQILEDILPTVQVLCQSHWGDLAGPAKGINFRARLNTALECFGSSLLTDREGQVINLVLHGHSTRNVAEKLSISVETVKLHRKHAYAKLEVRSQAELFYLFLDSVMSADAYRGGDPLTDYMYSTPD
jgi:DNA-binding CsgD family transcriptional regulator